MRKFTEKDKAALARAFRLFMQYCTGVKEPVKTFVPLIEEALEYGLTVDSLFNRENYSRAGAITPNPTARQYLDILLEGSIEVRDLKDEPYWMDMPETDFDNLSECYHEFYVDICKRGGRWSSINARQNFMRALDRTSLQALCSSELMEEVADVKDWDEDKGITIYQFIEKIANDLKTYHPDTSLTEEQLQRRKDMGYDRSLEAVSAPEGEDSDLNPENIDPQSLDDPYAGFFEDMAQDTNIVARDPRHYKRDLIWGIIARLSPKEIAQFAEVVGEEGEPVQNLEDMVNKMTDGKVMVEMEDGLQRDTHAFINGELSGAFISCVTNQGFEMNNDLAAKYDFLVDNWDLRDPKTRKLYKLKDLILTHASDDFDLIGAIPDLEDLYSEKE